MESSSFVQESYFPLWILSLTTTLLLIILTLRSLLRPVYCTCEICTTYIKSHWTNHFPNLCDWYTHLLKNSPTRTIHIHVLNNTITANLANVKHMLKTRFHNFPKGKPFSAILGDFLGRGIFNADGHTWCFQRKIATLELARVSTRQYSLQVVNQQIRNRLLPLMESFCNRNDVVDLQQVFRRFSFNTISTFSFGLDPNESFFQLTSVSLTEFEAAFDLASRLSAERALSPSPYYWKFKRFFNIGSENMLKRAIATVHKVSRDFIAQRKKIGFSNSKKDLLSRFMSSVDDEACLVDIVVSFLLAGRDTVASALTSFFWLVARHPCVEAAILADAEELHYLHATLYESMRLYPPVQFDSKFCSDDDLFPDGSFLRKGTRVTYHPYAMGRMEEIWGADCLEFKPERWLKDGVFVNEVSAFEYPVFQAGVRVCLGKEVAVVEIKSVAISVLRMFRIELVDTERTPRFSPGLTATFNGGLKVRLRPRVIHHHN